MASLTRKTVFIILLIAAIIRLSVLLTTDILPVMWDARRYVGAAIGLISIIDSPERSVTDAAKFSELSEKYIQGEQIEWLAYKPFTLSEAVNEIFIGGLVYPAMMAVVMAISPVADFFVIRIVNIILDLLSLWLLIQIAVRFIGRSGGVVAGLIYAIYFPFSLMTTQLLLEIPTTLLLLVSIYWLIRGYETDQRKQYLFAGIALGLLVMTKPTAILLAIPVMLWFIFYSREKYTSKLIVNRLIFVLIPLLSLTILWGGITSGRYGQLALRDPGYSEANLRSSSNITFEGYDLDRVEKEFWEYSVSEHIFSQPLGYLGLLTKKAERLWSKPANEFKKSFILNPLVWDYIHIFLFLTGLIGMLILLLQQPKVGSLILFICGYYTGIHLLFHSLARYSFNALPLLFVGSAYLIVLLLSFRKSPILTPPVKRIGAVIFVVALLLFDHTWVNAVFSIPYSYVTVLIILFIKILIVGWLTYKITGPILSLNHSIKKYIPATVFMLVLILSTYATTISRHEYAEFSTRIDNATMKAGTRIYLDKIPVVTNQEMIAAVIDVHSGPGRKNSFTITAGSYQNDFVGGKPPLSDLFYPKPTYVFYSRYEPKAIESFRQYAIVPLNPRQLEQDLSHNNYIELEISINNDFAEPNNYITSSGQFYYASDTMYIPGIRFTSIERYVHKNDPRIRYPVKIYSDSAISYYINQDETIVPVDGDLSPLPGKQTGRFNMYLIHFKPDGSFDVY